MKLECKTVTVPAIGVILLIALLLNIVFFVGYIASDDSTYMMGAKAILTGGKLDFSRVWGADRFTMTIPIAAVLKLCNNEMFFVHGLFILYSLILVFLTYFLGRTLHDERTGLVAAALLVISPVRLIFASMILPDILLAVLILGSVLLCLMLRPLRDANAGKLVWGAAALAGVVIGLACMTKATALIYIPILAMLLLSMSDKKLGLYNGIVLLGVALAGFSMTWLLDGELYHRLAVQSGVSRLELAQKKHLEEFSALALQQGLYPGDRLRTVWGLFESFYGNTGGMWVLIGPIILYPFLRNRSWLLISLGLLPFLYLCFGSISVGHYVPIYLQPRYFMPCFPIAAIMGGYCVSFLMSRVETGAGWRKTRYRWLGAGWVLGIVFLFASEFRRCATLSSNQFQSADTYGVKEAVQFWRHNHPETPVVLSERLSIRTWPLFDGRCGNGIIMQSGMGNSSVLSLKTFAYIFSLQEGCGESGSMGSRLDSLLQEAATNATGVAMLSGHQFTVEKIAEFSPCKNKIYELSLWWGASCRQLESWENRGVCLYKVDEYQ